MPDKKLIEQIKERLEKEREKIRAELQRFAKEDPKFKGDWDTNFPKHDGGVGSEALEEAADEVEEYAVLLPIEYSLETQLRDVENALRKIEKGEYGLCEKCKKDIEKERLEIYPAARRCTKCKK